MHPLETLIEILPTISPQSVSRTYFRAVDYDALRSKDPPNALWSGGPKEKGQRFTPPGGPDCLYVSETMPTAITEMRGLFSTVAPLLPFVVISIQVRLDRVLDITNPETQLRLGTSLTELTASWELQMSDNLPVPTHTLAEAAFSTGRFQAIRFASAQVEGEANLMIWTGLVSGSNFVEVYDRDSTLWRQIPE